MGAGPSEAESSGGRPRPSRAQIPGHAGAAGRACRALAREADRPQTPRKGRARGAKPPGTIYTSTMTTTARPQALDGVVHFGKNCRPPTPDLDRGAGARASERVALPCASPKITHEGCPI